ncbi:MAG: hypothetical protein ACK5TU_14150, partial [Cyclobacteriaceae bacterium]
GQNKALIDSLKSKLETAPIDQQFEFLNSIGWEYRFAKPDSTIYYCEQAYKIGKKENLKTNLAKPLNFLAVAYHLFRETLEGIRPWTAGSSSGYYSK